MIEIDTTQTAADETSGTKTKKKPSRGSSRLASAPAKKRSKRGAARWKGPRAHTRQSRKMRDAGRYVLVIHMSPEVQKKMDRRIAQLQKKTDDRISRSSFARGLVEKALR